MITRCALCPGVHRCLEPDGPEDADVLLVGEAPGKDEERYGKVFIGKTGQELDGHYLPLAGLRREGVRITNAIRCLPTSSGGKLDPSRGADLALLHSCATHHLYPEIERGKRLLVVPMGAFATRALVPNTPLDLHHGIPLETPFGAPAFPMFHPALGIHEPKKMLMIRTDWWRLKQYLAGKLTVPQDPYPEPDYREVTDVRELRDLDPESPLAADTESTRQSRPFCLTYSQQPGTGRLISSGRHDLLGQFNRRLQRWQAPILFHNWLYDWPVTEALGIQVPSKRVVDTMVRTYHLGNLPQGLKALAFRELGMVMEDFDDVVTPHSRALVLAYYRAMQDVPWPKPAEELVRGQDGKWKSYRAQGLGTKLKRFFTDYGKAPETKDIFQTWDNWEPSHFQIEAECGEWPGKCVSHAPFEKVLHYACRDADATLRLYGLLERMKSKVGRVSQEHWREV